MARLPVQADQAVRDCELALGAAVDEALAETLAEELSVVLQQVSPALHLQIRWYVKMIRAKIGPDVTDEMLANPARGSLCTRASSVGVVAIAVMDLASRWGMSADVPADVVELARREQLNTW